MHSCGHYHTAPLTRREMLTRCANGFGALALTSLMSERAFGSVLSPSSSGKAGALAPKSPHFPPKAQSVIFLYMDGGPSQVDTFDPKPRLTRENGQPFKMKMEPTQFNDNGSSNSLAHFGRDLGRHPLGLRWPEG